MERTGGQAPPSLDAFSHPPDLECVPAPQGTPGRNCLAVCSCRDLATGAPLWGTPILAFESKNSATPRQTYRQREYQGVSASQKCRTAELRAARRRVSLVALA